MKENVTYVLELYDVLIARDAFIETLPSTLKSVTLKFFAEENVPTTIRPQLLDDVERRCQYMCMGVREFCEILVERCIKHDKEER